jgi:hypothetical protein
MQRVAQNQKESDVVYFLIYCIFGVACILLVGALARRKYRNSYDRFMMRRSSSDNAILYSTLYVNNPSSLTVDTSSTTHHHSIDCGTSAHHAGSFDCGGGGHH